MAIENLKDVYIDQLQDMYSADDQAASVVKAMADAAKNPDLAKELRQGEEGIRRGMDTLSQILKGHDADPQGEFCKGMEGLVREARSHALEDGIADDDTRDAMIIAEYQRMAHYAIAGYGCLVAFAKRLELADEAQQLQTCLDATYSGDDTMTSLATGGINQAAKM